MARTTEAQHWAKSHIFHVLLHGWISLHADNKYRHWELTFSDRIWPHILPRLHRLLCRASTRPYCTTCLTHMSRRVPAVIEEIWACCRLNKIFRSPLIMHKEWEEIPAGQSVVTRRSQARGEAASDNERRCCVTVENQWKTSTTSSFQIQSAQGLSCPQLRSIQFHWISTCLSQ